MLLVARDWQRYKEAMEIPTPPPQREVDLFTRLSNAIETAIAASRPNDG
jgi:hypothetical protein